SEVRATDEGQRVRSAPVAVHARVLPLDREWARVGDSVQRPEERLEVDVAVTGRDEVPAARRLAEVEMTPEDALASVQRLARVLDGHVQDQVGERLADSPGMEPLVR